jgi:hypothetical protein
MQIKKTAQKMALTKNIKLSDTLELVILSDKSFTKKDCITSNAKVCRIENIGGNPMLLHSFNDFYTSIITKPVPKRTAKAIAGLHAETLLHLDLIILKAKEHYNIA